MALTVQWTTLALEDRRKVYAYWNSHNQSSTYSQRLENETQIAIQLLTIVPNMGTMMAIRQVRFVLIAHHFKLMYEVQDNQLIILRFWDTRQDPGLLTS